MRREKHFSVFKKDSLGNACATLGDVHVHWRGDLHRKEGKGVVEDATGFVFLTGGMATMSGRGGGGKKQWWSVGGRYEERPPL